MGWEEGKGEEGEKGEGEKVILARIEIMKLLMHGSNNEIKLHNNNNNNNNNSDLYRCSVVIRLHSIK